MIVVPLVVFAGGAVAVSSRLPNLYRAETTILLVPQRVPETYVQTTVTGRLEERLRTISPQILTRTRLEGLIKDLKLYPELSDKLLMEQIVEVMRRQVAIQPVKDTAVSIAFTYGEATAAAKVTERLASMFIDENIRDRETQADSTTRFLSAQLEDARRRLIEQDKRLEDYRKAHSGSLPSQTGSNLQMMQTTQQSLTMLADATNRLRDRRLNVERLMEEQKSAIATAAAIPVPLPVPAGPGAAAQTAAATPAQQLEIARQNLQNLLVRLQPEHPDVRKARRQIAELEQQLDSQAASNAATDTTAPRVTAAPGQVAAVGRLRELEAERNAIDSQLGHNQEEDARLRATLAGYQSRLEELPTRESELAELTRDYATLQATYQDLLAKHENSIVAANLERRQIGEQFRVIDAPRVPELPVSPNRLLLNGLGAVVGLLLGFGTALALEIFNTTPRTDDEVAAALGLVPLAMIPLLSTGAEKRGRKRRALGEAIGVAAVLVVGAAAGWWFLMRAGG